MELVTEVKQQEHEMNLAFALSDFYQLLSVSMQFPSQDLANALSEGGFWEDGLSILEDLTCSQTDIQEIDKSIEPLRNVNISAEELYQQMKQEYTRLFNDPKQPQLALYESLFLYQLKEKGEKPMLFLSQEAADAEKQYKEAGVKVDTQFREPADHIATQLEFMMFLYGNKGKAMNEQDEIELDRIINKIDIFQRKHLDKWVYAFFEKIEEETTLEHYRMIAKIAKVGLGHVKGGKLSH